MGKGIGIIIGYKIDRGNVKNSLTIARGEGRGDSGEKGFPELL